MTNRGDPNNWKKKLSGRLSRRLAREIDIYELQLELGRTGSLDARALAEAQRRRGVVREQRRRAPMRRGPHLGEGLRTQPVREDTAALLEVPAILRVELPASGLAPDQLDLLAALAEEYGSGVLTFTPRGEVQLREVPVEDTPDLMRRLAAGGISTRSAGSRRIHTCPFAGVSTSELFDVTPYAEAVERLLPRGDGASLSFCGSGERGCCPHTRGLSFRATTGAEEGERGFSVVAGAPEPVELCRYVEEADLLPFCRAVDRVFSGALARRLELVVSTMGAASVSRQLAVELGSEPFDPRSTAYLSRARTFATGALRATEPDHTGYGPAKPVLRLRSPGSLRASLAVDSTSPDDRERLDRWRAAHTRRQKQAGHSAVTVALPHGELGAAAARGLADLTRARTGDQVRAARPATGGRGAQLVLRFVRDEDLEVVFRALDGLGLAEPPAVSASPSSSG